MHRLNVEIVDETVAARVHVWLDERSLQTAAVHTNASYALAVVEVAVAKVISFLGARTGDPDDGAQRVAAGTRATIQLDRASRVSLSREEVLAMAVEEFESQSWFVELDRPRMN
jgi:hypothetical protein